jgi:vancomycin permeability regulator SanA
VSFREVELARLSFRAEGIARTRQWVRRSIRAVIALGLLGQVLVLGCVAWIELGARGHMSTVDDAPPAEVAIVFGAQLAPGGTQPMLVLRNRLDTAARLYGLGRAHTLLVSGDAGGSTGDEVAAMARYLVDRGVPPERIRSDPYGLDTYDTCARARQVYGVTRALLVTQGFHLARAVTLCRYLGIDAHGVTAGCTGCRRVTVVRNTVRDWLAAPKAAYDAVSGRPPAVASRSWFVRIRG